MNNCFCLLSYRVLGTPRSLLVDLCLPGPPFSSTQADAGNGNSQENKVEDEVRSPGQLSQDPSAGTRHPFKYMQQHQAGVTTEAGHQRRGKPKARVPAIFHHEQDNCNDFKSRNSENECVVEPGGKYLVEHLPAELFRFEQFSKCSISKQQYECPRYKMLRRVSFHCHFLFKANYLTQRLTVLKGWALGMPAFLKGF